MVPDGQLDPDLEAFEVPCLGLTGTSRIPITASIPMTLGLRFIIIGVGEVQKGCRGLGY